MFFCPFVNDAFRIALNTAEQVSPGLQHPINFVDNTGFLMQRDMPEDMRCVNTVKRRIRKRQMFSIDLINPVVKTARFEQR